MTNIELMIGFEAGTLSSGDFHHRDHVRLTWLYLQRYGRADAEARLAAGLRALAARAGRPEKFDTGLTRAWVELIDAARIAEQSATFEAFVAARPDLLDRRTIGARV